jgi:hypothetical protein
MGHIEVVVAIEQVVGTRLKCLRLESAQHHVFAKAAGLGFLLYVSSNVINYNQLLHLLYYFYTTVFF